MELKCRECTMKFQSPEDVSLHYYKAHKFKLSCNNCYEQFFNKSQLGNHMRQFHIDKRRIGCLVCNRTFRMMDDFKEHLKIEHPQPPFQCDVCPCLKYSARSLELHTFYCHSAPNAQASSASSEVEATEDEPAPATLGNEEQAAFAPNASADNEAFTGSQSNLSVVSPQKPKLPANVKKERSRSESLQSTLASPRAAAAHQRQAPVPLKSAAAILSIGDSANFAAHNVRKPKVETIKPFLEWEARELFQRQRLQREPKWLRPPSLTCMDLCYKSLAYSQARLSYPINFKKMQRASLMQLLCPHCYGRFPEYQLVQHIQNLTTFSTLFCAECNNPIYAAARFADHLVCLRKEADRQARLQDVTLACNLCTYVAFSQETKRAHHLWAHQQHTCNAIGCSERVEGLWRMQFVHSVAHASSALAKGLLATCEKISSSNNPDNVSAFQRDSSSANRDAARSNNVFTNRESTARDTTAVNSFRAAENNERPGASSQRFPVSRDFNYSTSPLGHSPRDLSHTDVAFDRMDDLPIGQRSRAQFAGDGALASERMAASNHRGLSTAVDQPGNRNNRNNNQVARPTEVQDASIADRNSVVNRNRSNFQQQNKLPAAHGSGVGVAQRNFASNKRTVRDRSNSSSSSSSSSSSLDTLATAANSLQPKRFREENAPKFFMPSGISGDTIGSGLKQPLRKDPPTVGGGSAKPAAAQAKVKVVRPAKLQHVGSSATGRLGSAGATTSTAQQFAAFTNTNVAEINGGANNAVATNGALSSGGNFSEHSHTDTEKAKRKYFCGLCGDRREPYTVKGFCLNHIRLAHEKTIVAASKFMYTVSDSEDETEATGGSGKSRLPSTVATQTERCTCAKCSKFTKKTQRLQQKMQSLHTSMRNIVATLSDDED